MVWSEPQGPKIDDLSPTWTTLSAHIREELSGLYESVAAERDPTLAAEMRGSIRSLKDILELAKPVGVQVLDNINRPPEGR